MACLLQRGFYVACEMKKIPLIKSGSSIHIAFGNKKRTTDLTIIGEDQSS